MLPNDYQQLIDQALNEDLPLGDVTTDNLDLEAREGIAHLVAKQDLVLCGRKIFEDVFKSVDSKSELKWLFEDSESVLKQQVVCRLRGPLASLLKAERVALNFLGRLSGISTLTSKYVRETTNSKTKILDTRKTTPGWRGLEKYAVVCGGGQNHRMNLSEAIMLKENHIRAAGGITLAVARLRSKTSKPIEVEVTNLDEVQEAVKNKVAWIMLDNMTNEMMSEALKIIPKNVKTEASGNMSLTRIKSVAQLGLDFISVGALTHSAPVADFSLLFEFEKKNQ